MKHINYLFAAGILALSTSATAAPTITGYDVSNADPSGTGGWSHQYSGTIVNLGSVRDYTGGTGTMADGIFGTSPDSTQLFFSESDASITVFLDDYYKIDSVSLFGGDPSDAVPGGIDSADFTVGSTSLNLNGFPFGPLGQSRQLVNDDFLFTSTGLDQIRTNQFTISGISASGGDFNGEWFSISEITVQGTISPVPEPSTYALMLGGLGLVGFMAARRRKQA